MIRVRNSRLPAIAAAVALLALMVCLSRDFGATWDERFQQKYGERIWDYWQGRLPASEFAPRPENEYLYGGLVEVLAVAAQHVVPADAYVVRHAVISVFGWAGIVFAGLLAARLYGPRAGWLTALLLTLAPRYFADSMNNPKDVPFAAVTIAVLYYTLTIDRRPPFLTWRHAAKLALAIALAINIRPLGLMLLAYSIGVIAVTVAASSLSAGQRPSTGALATVAATVALVALTAVPAGTVTWPWAHEHPMARPIEAFGIVSRLNWARGFPALYRGEDFHADSLPWHYVPVWFGISLPLVVLAGLALSPLLAWRRQTRRAAIAALLLFVATPIAAAIVQHATLYDGIRHLSFVVPPLAALAGMGWAGAIESARGRARPVAIALLAIGAAEPLIFQIRNHPNQAVYFSPIAGGPRAAFARYEMDYWGNSMLQAVEWANDLAARAQMPIVVTGNPVQIVQADAERFHSLAVVPRNAENAHLDIRLMRGPAASLKEFAARPDIVYKVTSADGTPLSIVLPGPAFGLLQQRLAREN